MVLHEDKVVTPDVEPRLVSPHAVLLAGELRLCIITPALPPKLDGIGDYTSRLVRVLIDRGVSVHILTDSQSESDPLPGAIIRKTFDPNRPGTNWNLIDSLVDERPDWVLIQYNPFGYGRRGLNLQLYRVLRKLKQVLPECRLAIMFHETYVPTLFWKLAIMAIWQRWQFRRLGRAADVMFYSIAPWADKHRTWFPGKPIYHLPVGSNMPHMGINKSEARQRLGLKPDEIVLGVFGTAHTSRLFGLVRQSAETLQNAGKRVRLLYIGPDGPQIVSLMGCIPCISDGPLPAEEVSKRLSAVDISLATYSDGVSTRRGAMMAALQHGLPIVGTIGIHTDPELAACNGSAMVLAPAGNSAAFCQAVLRVADDTALQAQLSAGGLALFNSRYSWQAIVSNLLDKLSENAGSRER